jgi:4-amino-4-deoxy-L-arabinose transferase-like glycosyltransferase
VAIFLFIWGASIFLRLTFVHQVLLQNPPASIVGFDFDSREYLHLAKNIAERGVYAIDSPESRFFAMLRTPGYPFFCAIFLKLGLGISGIFYAQAALGSLIPLIGATLAAAIFRSRLCASVTGAAMVLSTTGIGLGGILLPDLLFAMMLIAGFALTVAGAAWEKRWGWIGAGLLLAIAVLIKPAIVYLSPVLAVGWLLMAGARQRGSRWLRLGCVVGLPVLAVVAWAGHNYALTGRWKFSTIESQNLRHFMTPLTEESVKAGRLPDAAPLTTNHRAALIRDLDDIMSARLSPLELADRQKREAMAVLLNHPFWATLGLLNNSIVCNMDGWAWTPSQLPVPGVLGRMIFCLNRWQINFRILVLSLGFLVLLERLTRKHARATTSQRQESSAMGACAGLLIYFFIISGTSFSTGFRIMYPVEFTMILLAIGGIRAGWRMLAPIRTQIQHATA